MTERTAHRLEGGLKAGCAEGSFGVGRQNEAESGIAVRTAFIKLSRFIPVKG